MNNFAQFWQQGDAITRGVAALLLLMSISAWVLIFWKAWILSRVRRDIQRAVAAFWAAPSLQAGGEQLNAFDREAVLQPLLAAATAQPSAGTLETSGHLESQLTRRLRDALHAEVDGAPDEEVAALWSQVEGMEGSPEERAVASWTSC